MVRAPRNDFSLDAAVRVLRADSRRRALRFLLDDPSAITVTELADRIRGDYLDDQRRLKKDGESVVVCFGKHDGRTLRELQTQHADYFDWMYRTIDDLRPHIDEALT